MTVDPIRVGLSVTSVHAVKDPKVGARNMIERARAAKQAELDSLMLGDHHSTAFPYYQNIPMMGRLLAEWGDGEAGCLFLLPLWNPVLLAEQIGTLAAIAEGNFVVQCALGGEKGQFAAMGANIKARPSTFEEAVRILRGLLAGETIDGESRYAFTGAVANPHPAPGQEIEFWIASMSQQSLQRAVDYDGWECSPGETLEDAAAFLETYKANREAAGKPLGRPALRRDLFITADSQETQKVKDKILSSGYRGIDPNALVIGTVEEAAATFKKIEEIGFTDILARHINAPQADILSSFERLGEAKRLAQN